MTENYELEALLFDVDGTLADTERDGHRVAFNQAFTEHGLEWFWDEALYGELLNVTGGKERIRYYLETYLPDWQYDGDLDAYIAGLHAAKTRHYVKLMENGAIPLRPGVERLLREARERGLRLAVATTTTPANVIALLENTLGAESVDWFEVIAAGDMVKAKKPAPDIFQLAMQMMELKPENCIAFEDSINGYRSAAGAGIGTIVITVNGYTENDNFNDASLVIDQMGEEGAVHARRLSGLPWEGQMLTIDDLVDIHARTHELSQPA